MSHQVIRLLCISIVLASAVFSPLLRSQDSRQLPSGDSAVGAMRGAVDDGTLRYDSSTVPIRAMSSDAIDSYRDDNAFDYGSSANEAPEGMLETLWKWFGDAIEFILDNQFTGRTLLYIILIAGLLVAIYFVLKGERGGLLGAKGARSRSVHFEEEIEDIHAVDLEAMLESAMAHRDYRSAVRYQFLLLLRDLSKSDMIDWRQAKTNEDYRREIPEGDIRTRFDRLVHLFDWAWYGGYAVSPEEYGVGKRDFEQLRSMVAGRRVRR